MDRLATIVKNLQKKITVEFVLDKLRNKKKREEFIQRWIRAGAPILKTILKNITA